MKKYILASMIAVLLLCLAGCHGSSDPKHEDPPAPAPAEAEIKGVFLGVKDSANATRDIVFCSESPVYQFEIDGETKDFCVDCSDSTYPIQNRLMMGYEYLLKLDGNRITSAAIAQKTDVSGIVSGFHPGERTLKNFLKTAVSPLGKTLYVYGGGWNVQDDGSSYLTRTIGLSPTWEKFYQSTDASYSFEKDTYPSNGWNTYYYAGLDCSGYLGWVLYNTLYQESETEDGLVCSSTKMAKMLADKQLGTFEHPAQKDCSSLLNRLHPGDIVSMSGHCYIVIGTCDDGSAVILHSAATRSVSGIRSGGVQLSALSPNGSADTSCKAYALAKKYMETLFPKWTETYPVALLPLSTYLNFPDDKETSGIFTWNDGSSGLADPENLRTMSAEDVLKTIFE